MNRDFYYMIDIKYLSSIHNDVSKKHVELITEFVEQTSKFKKYLLGRNKYSSSLSKIIEVDGFVDDYYQESIHWLGKPVIKANSLSKDALVRSFRS